MIDKFVKKEVNMSIDPKLESRVQDLERNMACLEKELPRARDSSTVPSAPSRILETHGDLSEESRTQRVYRNFKNLGGLFSSVSAREAERTVMRGTAGAAVTVGVATVAGLAWPFLLGSMVVGAIGSMAAPHLKRFHTGSSEENVALPMTEDEALQCLGISRCEAENLLLLRSKYEQIEKELRNRMSNVPPLFAKEVEKILLKSKRAYEVLYQREALGRVSVVEDGAAKSTDVVEHSDGGLSDKVVEEMGLQERLQGQTFAEGSVIRPEERKLAVEHALDGKDLLDLAIPTGASLRTTSSSELENLQKNSVNPSQGSGAARIDILDVD